MRKLLRESERDELLAELTDAHDGISKALSDLATLAGSLGATEGQQEGDHLLFRAIREGGELVTGDRQQTARLM